MTSFQTHFERLELKFLIDEIIAERIRRQIDAYCMVDPHSRTGQSDGSNGYLIHSLYLDTPALAFHAAKERGDPNRVKLRVRTYTDSPTATLEVKRRRSNVIDKRRCMISRDLVPRAAQGRIDSEQILKGDSRDMSEFVNLVATSGAEPKLTVRYRREAYESLVDPYARVTFDRDIRVRPTHSWDLAPDGRDWLHFDDYWKKGLVSHPVVLELKCETAIPLWMTELVRANQLEQESISKYSVGTCLTQWRDGGDVHRSRSLGALA